MKASLISSWLDRWYPLIFIVIIALCARLYQVSQPVLDWHSFRQADTISVTYEYYKNGVDLLHPTYHDLSSIPSGKPNPLGYRMVEFPFLNALTAMSYHAVDTVLSIETWSRLWSIAWSLGTIVCLYHLGFWLTRNPWVGYAAASTAASMPFYIFYSRAVLPEAALTFFFTFSVVAFAWWADTAQKRWYIASLIALQCAALLKPFVLFFAGPFAVIVWFTWQLRALKQPLLYLFPIAAVIPFSLWRKWIEQFPEGIPAWEWLFNGTNIRFTPAWVRWLVWERLTKLWLGYTGILLLPLSMYQASLKTFLFLSSWWLGGALYVTVLATGNVTHDYYQVVLTPIVCLTLGVGIVNLFTGAQRISAQFWPRYSPGIAAGLVLLVCYSSLYLAWNFPLGGHTYFNINHPEYHQAGLAVRRNTPEDALVIAPHFGADTAFLWQTHRRGWPVALQNETTILEAVHNKRALGATHYITLAHDPDIMELKKWYPVIEETPTYTLFDLTTQLPQP